jgi:hypothetical protein
VCHVFTLLNMYRSQMPHAKSSAWELSPVAGYANLTYAKLQLVKQNKEYLMIK